MDIARDHIQIATPAIPTHMHRRSGGVTKHFAEQSADEKTNAQNVFLDNVSMCLDI